jgi:protoporphyrinogen oxidase
MERRADFLVLGGGVAGLAAASVLGTSAVVFERDDRPGGLVRTERFGEYCFDHVLHLLYFPDGDTEKRIFSLGLNLAPCLPRPWVETSAGCTKYPVQLHLSGLDPAAVARCLDDLAGLYRIDARKTPENFEQMLLTTFGGGLCDVFMLPYNRKVWKRPLSQLAPSGFTWNIDRPVFQQVLNGARGIDQGFEAYNAKGWYPRPPAEAKQRGIEVLAQSLAKEVANLRLEHVVESIDLESRMVSVLHRGQRQVWRFGQGCISTLPLPAMLRMCPQTPPDLRQAIRKLPRNRVLTATFSIRGPRPAGCGHWRYYSDESLIFTRLVFTHAFDPLLAPEDGWGLMAEIIEPAEAPWPEADHVLLRARADIERAGVVPAGSRVIDQHLLVVDPAYVVFTLENRQIIKDACEFLEEHDVHPLGRYGRWEYSSMAQVMRDGFALAERLRGQSTMRTVPETDSLYERVRR